MRTSRGLTEPGCALASGIWSLGPRHFTSQGYAALSGSHLPGQPDLLFPDPRVVVFLDRCFGRGCETSGRSKPPEYSWFWPEKIATNRRCDRLVPDELTRDGWTVIRIGEHEIGTAADLRTQAEELGFLGQREASC